MSRSGCYASYLPQLPNKPSAIAVAKRPSPMKRYAPTHPLEASLYSASKRQRLIPRENANSTAMYSVFVPGPQYMHESSASQPCTNHPFNFYTSARSDQCVPILKEQKTSLCCGFSIRSTNSPSYTLNNKENSCHPCPKCPTLPRRNTRSHKQAKRRSPATKSRKMVSDSKPFTYSNFLVTLEKKGKLKSVTSVKSCGTGYSNGFVPNLTSTPVQAPRKVSMYMATTLSTKQCTLDIRENDPKTPLIESKSNEITDELLDVFLKNAENADLPVELSNKTIADILETMDKNEEVKDATPQESVDNLCNESSDGNNNNKTRKRRVRKLPGMYPLGAPRAASSPIHPSLFRKEKKFEVFEEKIGRSALPQVCISKKKITKAPVRPLENITNKRLSASTMWRPW